MRFHSVLQRPLLKSLAYCGLDWISSSESIETLESRVKSMKQLLSTRSFALPKLEPLVDAKATILFGDFSLIVMERKQHNGLEDREVVWGCSLQPLDVCTTTSSPR